MQPQQEQPDYWRQSGEAPQATQPDQADRPLPDVSSPVTENDVEQEAELQPISWQASEYIHHEKQTAWFIGLAVATVALLAISIVVIKSWSFALLVVVMAGAVGYMALRPPRIVNYRLTQSGIDINEKHFNYEDFHSFGVINEGPLYSILLMPNKRFMPQVTMYFPADKGESIIDLLGSLMPMQEVKLDAIDRLGRKLRF